MASGASGNTGPAPGSVDNANLVSLLGTTRTLTRIWVIVGGLVALVNVLGILFWIFAVRFPGGYIGGLLYALIWVVADLMILERFGGWSSQLAFGHYQALKEPLLLWGILGLIFGVVPGVLLLIVYVRVLPWGDNPAPPPPEKAEGAAATAPPPASRPVASPTASPPESS